jgi:hypothetical protein
MNKWGPFPFGKDDIDPSKRALNGKRHSLFDAHSIWREHFPPERE